ncbi:uncharacterized protein LOC132191068 [Corylus avellana]|uniref:uncharacterized protein LOC132191068 n=1 Tax=Corylus avellana TaxID=13451 RepID=UPI00286A45C2|nr:uncharacterized protein LOC132191068 [Corylus avellana]
MSEKKRESAAVESGEKTRTPWPMSLVVGIAVFYLGGLGIMRSLNIFHPSFVSFIGDVVHMVGAIFLGASAVTQGQDTCAGLSLKSLHLTALHLAVKVSYGGLVESEFRVFDVFSILGTLVAIYMVGFKYKSSYVDKKHNFNLLYLVSPQFFCSK